MSTLHLLFFLLYTVGLETFKHELEVGQAGDQLGALVRGVKREDVRRGMVLCPPGSLSSHTQLKGQVYTIKYPRGQEV